MLDGDLEDLPDRVDTVTAAVLENARRDGPAADFQFIRRITRVHTTPLPDAETLATYGTLIPNGAERILSLVEREAEHRHRRELREMRHIERSHWMAYSLAVALSGAGLNLGAIGHESGAAGKKTAPLPRRTPDTFNRGRAP